MAFPGVVFIADQIQTEPLGSGLCGPGWTGPVTIEPYSGGPNGIGQYPGAQWAFFGPPNEVFSSIHPGPPPQTVSFFMGFKYFGNGFGSFPQLIFYVFDPLSFLQVPVLFINGNSDGSLTAVGADGSIICNSGAQMNSYLFQGQWYFMQVNAQFGAASGQITITVDVAIQGSLFMSGSKTTTTSPASGLGTNQFSITTTSVGDMGIGQMTFSSYVPLALTNPSYFPSQPTPPDTPHAQIGQAVVEAAIEPSDSNATIRQGVIELAKLPNNSNVRIHQGVIEIATSGRLTAPGGPRPEYIKRHNAPAND